MNLVTDYGQQTGKVRGRLYFQRVKIKCSRLLRDGRLLLIMVINGHNGQIEYYVIISAAWLEMM